MRTLNVCRLTKSKFLYRDDVLKGDAFLGRQEQGSFGVPWVSMKKLVIVGFKASGGDSLPYALDLEDTEVDIVGPERKGKSSPGLRELLALLGEIVRNRRIFKDVDIIFADFNEYTFFEVVLIKWFTKNAKAVIYLIGDYPEANYERHKNGAFRWMLEVLISFCQRVSDEFWFISEYLKEKYPMPPSKSFCIVHSSNLKASEIASAPHRASTGALKIIYVARLEKEKRPEVILGAVKILKEGGMDVRLGIVGDGNLREGLTALASVSGIGGDVDFYGKVVDRAEIFRLYRDADMFLFSSVMGEGMPLVLIEALSQGLPVVATYFGGIEEVVKEGVNGCLVRGRDPHEDALLLATKARYLYENPRVYEAMSKSSIEAMRRFTIEAEDAAKSKRILELLGTQKENKI